MRVGAKCRRHSVLIIMDSSSVREPATPAEGAATSEGANSGVEVSAICKIAHSTPETVKRLLRADSGEFPVTKSIINILHNIRLVGSIPVTKAQKRYLNNQESVVAFLLNDSHSINKLRSKLVANPKLVIFIAGVACALNAASLSQLQGIGN